ncbi:deoxyribodipyrimidine photo-lyase [Vibrio sp. WXL210]|uniref:deoxyribodipyrimidine photo-lyase n=1 Tax=Vibrio sp. WXL210 TaxID=3450709 RepID=UPI003EC4F5AB
MHLVWLRRDLRVDDNPALAGALASGEAVVAVYIATPEQWQSHGLSHRQADLIWRRLFELQQDLTQLNVPLLYVEETDFHAAVERIASLCAVHEVNSVHANREYELNEVMRDQALEAALREYNVDVTLHHDRCLMVPGSVTNKQGHYFKVFTPFKKALLSQWQPAQIVKNKPASHIATTEADWPLLDGETSSFSYPRQASDDWAVTTSAIRAKLREFCQQSVGHYHQERDFPSLDSTSRLSPYLAIGALSVRQCVARMAVNGQHQEQGGEVWLSELIWRDFYQHLIYFEPRLCQHQDFIAWGANVKWSESEQHLLAWQQGRTGYPIVDAAMRQLNQTGWMHNRLRMVVASFLTKDLHIDWRKGEHYFMTQLIDGDFASNNGGWQWCASTGCDGQPYFRIFNPTSQGERFDPEGDFVCHWIPELKQVPTRYVHTPWLWSGFNGLDYPPPIVDHKAEREITLAAYKQAKDVE